MESLSLSELKAQNEAESQQPEIKPKVEEVEIAELEVDEKIEDEQIEVEETDELEEGKTDEELEDWQKGEDNESGKGEFKPSAEAKRLRLKAKDLKAQNAEKDTELEDLRRKVESLVQPKAPEQAALPAKPKLEDFDYDDAAHEQAVDAWYDKKFDLKLQTNNANSQQVQAQEQQTRLVNQQRENAVESHLNKAATLINEGKVSQDKWLAGDKLIRQTVESVMQGQGNIASDQFIALMEQNGEGSEKAWYYLGNNPTALMEFRDKLQSDQTGASALMFLGAIQTKATQSLRKKRSEAPKPAPNVKGDASAKVTANQKKYEKSTDVGERIRLKRAAKQAGQSVSHWN